MTVMWFFLYMLVAGLAIGPTWAYPIPRGWKESSQITQTFWDSMPNRNDPAPPSPKSKEVAKRGLWGPLFPSLQDVWDNLKDSPLANLTPVGTIMDVSRPIIGALFGASLGYDKVGISKGKLECWSDELWREHGGWCLEEGPNFPQNPDLHHPPASEPTPEPAPTTIPELASTTVPEPAPATIPELVPTIVLEPTPTTETPAPSSTFTEPGTVTINATAIQTEVSTTKEEFNDVSGMVDFTPPVGSPETWSTTDMMSFYKSVCIVDTNITGTFAPLLDQAGRELCFAVEYFLYAEADAAMAADLDEDDPTFDGRPGGSSFYNFANATPSPLSKLAVGPSPTISPANLDRYSHGIHTRSGLTDAVNLMVKEIFSQIPPGGVSNSTSETRIADAAPTLGSRGADSQFDKNSQGPPGSGSGGKNIPGSSGGPAGHAAPNNQGLAISQSGTQTSGDPTGSGNHGGNDPVPGYVNSPDYAAPAGQGATDLTSSADNPPEHAALSGPETIDSTLGIEVPSMAGALAPNNQPRVGDGVTLDNVQNAPTTGAIDSPLSQPNRLETATAHAARQGRKFRRMNHKIHYLLNDVEERGYMHKNTAAEFVKLGIAETPETMELLGIPYTEVAAAIEGIKIFAELPYVPYSLPEGYCWRNAEDAEFGDHLEYFKRYSLRLGRDPKMYAMKDPPPTEWEAPAHLRPPKGGKNPWPHKDDEGVINQVTNLAERPEFVSGLLAYSGLEGTMITPEIYSQLAIYGRWWANTHGFRNRYFFKNVMQGMVPHATKLFFRLVKSHRMLGGAGTIAAMMGAWGVISYYQSMYILDKAKNGEPVREWQKPMTDGDWPWLTDVVTETKTISGRRVTEMRTTSSQFSPAHFHPESMLNPWYTESLDPSLISTAPAAADQPGPMTASLSSDSPLISDSLIPPGWYIPNPPVGLAAAVSVLSSSETRPDTTRPGDILTYQQPVETGSPNATQGSSSDTSNPKITKAPSIAVANSNGNQVIYSKLGFNSSTYHPPQQPYRANTGAETINDAKSLVFKKGVINVWALTGFQGNPEDEPPLKPHVSAPALQARSMYHLIPTGDYRRHGTIDRIFGKFHGKDQNSTLMHGNSSLPGIDLYNSTIPDSAGLNFTRAVSCSSTINSNASQWNNVYWRNSSSSIDGVAMNASKPWTAPIRGDASAEGNARWVNETGSSSLLNLTAAGTGIWLNSMNISSSSTSSSLPSTTGKGIVLNGTGVSTTILFNSSTPVRPSSCPSNSTSALTSEQHKRRSLYRPPLQVNF